MKVKGELKEGQKMTNKGQKKKRYIILDSLPIFPEYSKVIKGVI